MPSFKKNRHEFSAAKRKAISQNLPEYEEEIQSNEISSTTDASMEVRSGGGATAATQGRGNNSCIRTFEETWTYQDLFEKANQIAHVLVDDLGLQSGNRVLIRSANNPMMVACWFAIHKAGGIVVATMPLLRSKELTTIIDCAEISHGLS